jgi:FtsX-like permease family protein
MATGVAIGVALLIGGLGIVPALQARHAREDARRPMFAADSEQRDVLLWAETGDRVGKVDLLRQTVAAVGRAPVPPGLTSVPAPGEFAASPALVALLATPIGELVKPRLPGRMTEVIQPEGLIFPEELVAYVGVDASTLRPPEAASVAGFGRVETLRNRPVSLALKILVVLGVLGLLVPTLVFVATSTRLSAATRERRLAAIRLVGATPGQARLLAAIESGLGAALGSLLGLVLFFLARPLVARLPVAGYHWFASDIAPPVGQAVAVLVSAPVLAVGAALFSLRRLMVTPLGVTRRARVRRAGARRLVPLFMGVGGLGLCWAFRRSIQEGGAGGLAAVGASFLLVLLGVAAVAPWLGVAVAPIVAAGNRRIGALLGARRFQADPTTAGRVVAAMALLVFAAGVALALVPAGESVGSDVALAMRPTSMVIESESLSRRTVRSAVGRVAGVRAIVPLPVAGSDEDAQNGADRPYAFSAWIVDCLGLRQVLVPRLPSCGPHSAYVDTAVGGEGQSLQPGQKVPVILEQPDGSIHRATLRVPDRIVKARLATSEWQLGVSVILPPSALPATARKHLQAYRTLVATDGREQTMEEVRNAIASVDPRGTVRTLDQARAGADTSSRQTTALVDLGVLVALGIALANLLVVTVDHVRERKRPMAVLAASGVPLRVLRRSVAVEVAVPLLPAIGLAAGLSIAVAALFGSIIDQSIVLPLAPAIVLSALSLATVGAVTALTFPSVSRAARPETLQVE